MKAVLSMTRYSFLMFLRDRSALFWGILFPVLLMGLIGLVFGRSDNLSFDVSLVNEARDNPTAAGLQAGFREVDAFEVREEPREQALAALREGKRSLVIVLPAPAGGPEPYRVQVFFDESRPQVSQAAVAMAERVVNEGNQRLSALPPALELAAEGVNTRRLSMFDFLLPGILAMTVMQTGLMGVTWVVTSYREKLVLKRVLTTPVRPSAFFTGLIARFTVINLLQVAIIFAIATLVFGARTGGSVAGLFLLAAVGSVAFLGMGFAISAVSRTAEAASNLGSLFNFPMMFLSGTFWPREMIPDSFQPLISALPLTPLVEAMRGVGARGEPLTDFIPGLLYLLGWGAAGFLVSARSFRVE